jgi:hypothetical protein
MCVCLVYLHAQTGVGMVGTILYWSGIFNILDVATANVRPQLPLQLGAAVAGAAVVLYVIQSEDQAAVEAHAARERAADFQSVDVGKSLSEHWYM